MPTRSNLGLSREERHEEATIGTVYPARDTVANNVERSMKAGYTVLDHLTLPSKAWWDGYYSPMLDRIAVLRPEAASGSTLAQVLHEAEREIDMFRRFGDTYGYVFYLLRRAE